jgi:integrase
LLGVGHIRRRKLRGGVAYLARYRGLDGRERSRQFGRRSDAERFLASSEVAKAEGSWVDPSGGRVRLADWVREWQEAEQHSLRPTTLARDRLYLRTRILPTFGELPLARVSHQHVQAWVNELSASYAPTTVHKCHQILRKAMGSAVRSRLIAVNPCDGIQLPKVERQEMRFLTPPEVARLADAIDPPYRAFVLLGAYGGLRLGEMTGLRWGRVDLLRRRVDVAEISYEVDSTVCFGPPKTKSGRRTVPVPESVALALAATTERPPAPDDLVVRSPQGTPVRHGLFRQRVWGRATAQVGLDGVRIHDLRHTAVALWIAAGASVNEIARRAGHTSVVTVLDRYGHLLPGTEDKLTDALERLAEAAVLVSQSDHHDADRANVPHRRLWSEHAGRTCGLEVRVRGCATRRSSRWEPAGTQRAAVG